jgi:hypothetical protein
MRVVSAISIAFGIVVVLAIAFVVGLVLPDLVGGQGLRNTQGGATISRAS